MPTLDQVSKWISKFKLAQPFIDGLQNAYVLTTLVVGTAMIQAIAGLVYQNLSLSLACAWVTACCGLYIYTHGLTVRAGLGNPDRMLSGVSA